MHFCAGCISKLEAHARGLAPGPADVVEREEAVGEGADLAVLVVGGTAAWIAALSGLAAAMLVALAIYRMPFGLVLSAAFALAWLDATDAKVEKPWVPTIAAALSLAMLVLARPFTAVAICLPFAFHGLYLLVKGGWELRRRLLVFAGIVLALSSLYFLWQYAVTGDALLNPYTLWWSYDKIGFGPGFGHTSSGHNWTHAEINTKFSLWVGYFDLFGWGQYSWIFLPFGILAAIRQRMGRMLLVGSVIASLVVVYMAYWIGSSLFGPRYYYEGLYSLTLLSALGIATLAGWPVRAGDLGDNTQVEHPVIWLALRRHHKPAPHPPAVHD